MRITFLRPMDQFLGADRLIDRLRNCLRDSALKHLRLQVAFAKSGPLLRLADEIERWRLSGKSIEATFGIDLLGTSRQALEFTLQHFNQTYITSTTANSTFHPKFYLFYGDESAVCICGSQNLTVGGTETNLEGGIQIDFARPGDDADFQGALAFWNSLLPANCSLTRQLDATLLADLLRHGLLCDERAAPHPKPGMGGGPGGPPGPFPYIPPRPPSALPPSVFPQAAARGRRRARRHPPQPAAETAPPVQALIIQVVPHHNGEVFLSKLAVNENPAFFGFPFTGRTVPKKPGNPAYPQRVPDPLVNITVFDASGRAAMTRRGYSLNTVYYEKKSEIRITLSPDLVGHISPFSVMVMRQGQGPHDYDIEVYNPGSAQCNSYLGVCNQTLPSGGATRARKMGWL